MYTVTTPWGNICYTTQEKHMDEKGRTVLEKGTLYLKPCSCIPIHLHENESECYIPLSPCLKILVIDTKELKKLSPMEIERMAMDLLDAKVGEPIYCYRGQSHMVINDTKNNAHIEFIKFI